MTMTPETRQTNTRIKSDVVPTEPFDTEETTDTDAPSAEQQHIRADLIKALCMLSGGSNRF